MTLSAADDAVTSLSARRRSRSGPAGRPARSSRQAPEPALWFVTVTCGGEPVEAERVRRGLERLSLERPFVVSAAYRDDLAEVRYWDESMDAEGAVAQALRMWADHEESAGLPPWRVQGVEVLDRDTARRRWERPDRAHIVALGEIRPLDADR